MGPENKIKFEVYHQHLKNEYATPKFHIVNGNWTDVHNIISRPA